MNYIKTFIFYIILTSLSSAAEECRDLNIGDSKVFQGRGNERQTKIVEKYALERVEQNSYKVHLNIEFQHETESKKMRMKQKVLSCLDIINPHLKGEDGTKIDIAIHSYSETMSLPINKQAPLHYIYIAAPRTSANSSYYPEDITCATILHELLHLTGLVDEYVEHGEARYVDTQNNSIKTHSEILNSSLASQIGSRFLYRGGGNYCRVGTKKTSIMKKESDHYSLAIPRQLNCKCEKNTCQSIFRLSGLYQDLQLLNNFHLSHFVPNLGNICYKQPARFGSGLHSLSDFPASTLYTVKSQTSSTLEFTHNKIDTNTIGLGFLTKDEYSCQCYNSECQEDFEKLKTMIRRQVDLSPYACPADMNEVSRQAPSVVTRNYEPIIEIPMLYRGQIAKILAGTCEQKAQRYNHCASFAYELTNDCAAVQSFCESDEGWLQSSH